MRSRSSRLISLSLKFRLLLFRAVPDWVLLAIIAVVFAVSLSGCDRESGPAIEGKQSARLQKIEGNTFSQKGAAESATTQTRELPLYELRIHPKDMSELERNPFSDQTRPGTFIAEGKEYAVRIRHRGAWARSWPKKALKIFFEKGREFQGNECLNLNSAWRDPAFIREPLAYHIYAISGVPAPTCRMVRLDLNGKFRGLYVEVEQPDKPFLKRHDLKGAAIYKANSRDNLADQRNLGSAQTFSQHYEKETRKSESNADLQTFCRELASTTNVAAFFNQKVDLEKYINYLAATALVQNWDCFNKNHFFVHDQAGSDKWFAVPWDLDRTFGDHWHGSFQEARLPLLLGSQQHPGPTGWNRLADRFFADPTFRGRFLKRLQELLEKEFTREKLFPVVDRMESEIRPVAVSDRKRWPGAPDDLHQGISEVKNYIEERRKFLLREIGKRRG